MIIIPGGRGQNNSIMYNILPKPVKHQDGGRFVESQVHFPVIWSHTSFNLHRDRHISSKAIVLAESNRVT